MVLLPLAAALLSVVPSGTAERAERFEGALLAQADAPVAESAITLAEPTAAERELARLKKEREGIFLVPTIITLAGAGLSVVGVVMMLATVGSASFSNLAALTVLIISLPVMGVGGVALITGLIIFAVTGGVAAILSGKIATQQQLVDDERAKRTAPAPATQRDLVAPGLLLATF